MTGAVCIIPARLESSRFPGKVLASETGRPLIQHVVEQVRSARTIGRIVVAADDERVARAVASFGGEVVMTSPAHTNGTSRLGEACDRLGLADEATIVNVQGDEPEIEPACIDQVVEALEGGAAPVATGAYPFEGDDDPNDPHAVKVVRRLDGTALYFSRACVPHDRDWDSPERARPLHHLGLYAYRRSFLRVYLTLSPTPLEQAEKLEQLRILEHGHSIVVAICPAPVIGVGGIDTREQYDAFVGRWHARTA